MNHFINENLDKSLYTIMEEIIFENCTFNFFEIEAVRFKNFKFIKCVFEGGNSIVSSNNGIVKLDDCIFLNKSRLVFIDINDGSERWKNKPKTPSVTYNMDRILDKESTYERH